MPPREAVAELVREILEKDYEISEDANSSGGNGGNSRRGNPSQSDVDLLDAQWEAYSTTRGQRLPGEPLLLGSAARQTAGYGKRFRDRKSFDRATDAEREAELKRLGVSDREIEKAKKRLLEEGSRRAVANR